MKQLLKLLLLLLISSASYSQASLSQRLVIGSMDLEILAQSASLEVESYCIDHYRAAPKDLGNYKYVQFDGDSKVYIGDQPPVNLQTAIDNGSLEITGNGLGHLGITNKTDKNIRVVSKPSVFGDTPGDKRGLTNEAVSHVHDGTPQMAVWEARDPFSAEEEKIAVYQFEKLLDTNDPDAETL